MRRTASLIVLLLAFSAGAGPSSKASDEPAAPKTESVIFAVDANATTLGKMAGFKEQLQAAVSVLKPSQRFDILAAAEKAPTSATPALVAASAENKQKALGSVENLTGLA